MSNNNSNKADKIKNKALEYLNANYARNAQKAKFCLRNKEKRG